MLDVKTFVANPKLQQVCINLKCMLCFELLVGSISFANGDNCCLKICMKLCAFHKLWVV